MNIEKQTNELPVSLPPQVELPKKLHKKRLIVPLLIAVIVIVGVGASYVLLKNSSMKKQTIENKKTTSISSDTSAAEKDTIKLVKVTYTRTTPDGAQNSNDYPPIFANGSYLELNGNGELNYNDSVVKKDVRIIDAVLSRDGKHYAYRLKLSSENNSQIPSKSELYIDNSKVTELDSSELLAIANNGKDYLVKSYSNKVTSSTYNSGVHEEIIKLNNTKNIVSSSYGFLSGQYSADLKNVLVLSRRNDAGADWYFNDQKLSNCSHDNTANDSTILSADGSNTMCSVYTIGKAQIGSSLVYNINKLQNFINNAAVANIANPIDADGVALNGFADKNNWLLFVGGKSVLTADGTLKPLSQVIPEAATALKEKNCEGYSNLSNASIAFISNSKFAVLIPCSSKKLFTKGFNLTNIPDFSQKKFLNIEYFKASKTLYTYIN